MAQEQHIRGEMSRIATQSQLNISYSDSDVEYDEKEHRDVERAYSKVLELIHKNVRLIRK